MESKSIVLLNNATKMLAEVQTIDDAKNLMDMASAAKHYAKKHGLGVEAVSFAKSIEISAEIKLGEILKPMEKNKGGGDQKSDHRSTMSTGDNDAPTLREIYLSLSDHSGLCQDVGRTCPICRYSENNRHH